MGTQLDGIALGERLTQDLEPALSLPIEMQDHATLARVPSVHTAAVSPGMVRAHGLPAVCLWQRRAPSRATSRLCTGMRMHARHEDTRRSSSCAFVGAGRGHDHKSGWPL